jgi:predicted GIY-YIG superfamily endonuclease
MIAGYLYIVQYPGSTLFKVGRTTDTKTRLKQYPKGTEMLFSVVTSASNGVFRN